TQIAGGTFRFNVAVTCMNVYDGNRAKIGGIVEQSTDSDNPPGTYAWFQVFDNGQGAGAPPDQSSLVGFGDEAANEAFCNSPNLPGFGPWNVSGGVQVSSGAPDPEAAGRAPGPRRRDSVDQPVQPAIVPGGSQLSGVLPVTAVFESVTDP